MSSAATVFSQSFSRQRGPDLKLRPDDLVVGYQSHFTDVEPLSWVYFAATRMRAILGRHCRRQRTRTNLLEPSGPIMNDPNLTDKKFPSSDPLNPPAIPEHLPKWHCRSMDGYCINGCKDEVANATPATKSNEGFTAISSQKVRIRR